MEGSYIPYTFDVHLPLQGSAPLVGEIKLICYATSAVYWDVRRIVAIASGSQKYFNTMDTMDAWVKSHTTDFGILGLGEDALVPSFESVRGHEKWNRFHPPPY